VVNYGTIAENSLQAAPRGTNPLTVILVIAAVLILAGVFIAQVKRR